MANHELVEGISRLNARVVDVKEATMFSKSVAAEAALDEVVNVLAVMSGRLVLLEEALRRQGGLNGAG